MKNKLISIILFIPLLCFADDNDRQYEIESISGFGKSDAEHQAFLKSEELKKKGEIYKSLIHDAIRRNFSSSPEYEGKECTAVLDLPTLKALRFSSDTVLCPAVHKALIGATLLSWPRIKDQEFFSHFKVAVFHFKSNDFTVTLHDEYKEE